MVPLKVDTSGNITSEGPPTPTHSETQDCIDARKCKSFVLYNIYIVQKNCLPLCVLYSLIYSFKTFSITV